VQLPDADRAVIHVEELRDYLLDLGHRTGGSKATLLYRIGYRREEWRQLERDIREQLLPLEAVEVPAEDGQRFRVAGVLRGPNGSTPFRTVWLIEREGSAPRLLTAYPVRRL
jgi:hypothetical protein